MKKYPIISIIREARIDENRTPLTPNQIQTLSNKFPNLQVFVQPSKTRCFKDEDYSKAGAKIKEDISYSDIIFGVKEVEISTLIENKTYLFFSHTSKVRKDINQATQNKAIIYKKELLREVIKRKITLIDYENIRETSGKGYRYLGFGRFAGIVGCYNTLNLYLKLQKEQSLPRAFEINSYKKIQELLSKQNFNKLKILQTGKGNVAKGSMEILKHTNIKQINTDIIDITIIFFSVIRLIFVNVGDGVGAGVGAGVGDGVGDELAVSSSRRGHGQPAAAVSPIERSGPRPHRSSAARCPARRSAPGFPSRIGCSGGRTPPVRGC